MGLDLSLFSEKELLSLRRKYVLTAQITNPTTDEFYLAISGASAVYHEIERRNKGRNKEVLIRE